MDKVHEPYGWQSPFDESNADLPVTDAIIALEKYRDGEELTRDEEGLVVNAFACRPDLVAQAGIKEGTVYNA
jgi:hypothetical protein